jgi:hypothetical protein
MYKKVFRLVRVLFASPGDTAEETAVAAKVVEEINQIWGERTGVWLKALMWETDTYSATGGDAQAVINRELGDDYEAFVGIMRERFGSPTARYESGTQEEYLRACARHDTDQDSVDIGFYFSTAPIPRDRLSVESMEQLRKLLAFREELRRKGTLDRDYADIDEFEVRVRLHLSRLMQKFEDRLASKSQSSVEVENHWVAGLQPLIAGLPPLSEETLLQDVYVASDYINRATGIGSRVAQTISRFGQQAEVRAGLLQDAVATNDPAAIAHVLKEGRFTLARELEEAGDAIGPLVIPFAQSYRGALLPASRVAAYIAATKTNVDGARGLADALDVLRPEFDDMRRAMELWRNSLIGLGTPTLEAFRNRHHCLYAVDALLTESKSISSLMSDVASALRDAAE